MPNCKHARAHLRGVVTFNYMQSCHRESAIDRCNDCGAYLSLGPANDTPEVLVEIRAAEIVALARRGGARRLPIVEHFGWLGQETADITVDTIDKTRIDKDVPLNLESPSWLAGFLARCITSQGTNP